MQSLFAWLACVAGAGPPQHYAVILREAELADFAFEDHAAALLEMLNDIRRRLLAVELAAGLGKVTLGEINLGEGKRLARRAVAQVRGGTLGYTLIAAQKR